MGMRTSFRNQPPGRHLVVSDADKELGVLEIRELGTGVLYVEAKDSGSTACSKEIEAPAPSPPPWSVVAAEARGREGAPSPPGAMLGPPEE